MTILTALQSAAIRLVGYRPTTIFSSTEQTELELADLANEVAKDIMRSYDWQSLTRLHTITGDGVQTAFPFPDDYDRMVKAQGVHDGKSWFWNYTRCADLDTWISLKTGNYLGMTPGWWIILEDQFQFLPAPVAQAHAVFPYISRFCVKSAPAQNTGVITPQDKFLSDGDTFFTDEDLITLGVIWRYREQKGMGYAEDMANYETALAQVQGNDKGARVLRTPQFRDLRNTTYAYPWPLGQ